MLIGIVGAPSKGKSTFFSAATLVDVKISPIPFTTIEPNRGMGFVRVECVDKEFGTQCNPRTGICVNHTRFVPIELMDVAGLVPGAHEGKGRGNQFLDDLRQADALIHVVDASGSTNERGESVALNGHDPAKDIVFLEEEIDYWFLGVLKKNWGKFSKMPADAKGKRVELIAQQLSGLQVNEKQIEFAMLRLNLSEKKLLLWSEEELKSFASELRAISKPIVIAANKSDVPGALENVKRMKEMFPEKKIAACSAISELTLKKASKDGHIEYLPGSDAFKELKELNAQQQQGLQYIQSHVLSTMGSTGVQEVLEKTVFEELGQIAIFPGGTKGLSDSQGRILPDCFLLPKGSNALDFAFKLHTDMGQGFIRAIDVKTKKMVGKEHALNHRDVIEIVFKAP